MILYVVRSKEFKGYHSVYTKKALAKATADYLGYGYFVEKLRTVK